MIGPFPRGVFPPVLPWLGAGRDGNRDDGAGRDGVDGARAIDGVRGAGARVAGARVAEDRVAGKAVADAMRDCQRGAAPPISLG